MSDMEVFATKNDEVAENFKVDTLEKAEWCMRTKGKSQAEIDRFTEMAAHLKAEYCEQIDERLAEITSPHLKTLENMTSLLRPWSEVEIAKQGKARSYKLLSGTVGFRQAPDSLEVKDEAAALLWIKQHDIQGCIRVKEEVKKTETKKFIESTGEVPDGCALRPGEIRFYADPLPPLLEKK